MAFEVESTNDASDLSVREIKVRGLVNGATAVSNAYVNSVALYHGNTMLDQKSGTQLSTNGEVVFQGFNVKVAKNSKETFFVKASFLDNESNATHTVRFSVTDFLVEDDERNSLTIAGFTSVQSVRIVTLS